MKNLMSYSELSDLSERKKILLKDLACAADMTLRGFREAFNKKSLGAKAIVAVCNKLCITPNDLFEWSDECDSLDGNDGCKQTYMDVSVLQSQLEEKDKQINRLLDLLSKA